MTTPATMAGQGETGAQARRVALRLGAYLVLALGALLMIGPFLWMVSTAFKGPEAAFAFPPEFVPRPFTLRNFAEVWTIVPFGRYLFNSAFVAGMITIAELITASLAAYAFARLRFPGREALFLLYLGTLMIPGQVTLIPNFVLMRYLGWLNTYQGLIVPAAFTAFGTFLLRQFFLTIPRELEEAGRIDGCSYLGIYWRIILPLSGPALATLGVFSFMGAWNAFLWPLVMISDKEMRTLTVALRSFQSEYGTEWTYLMAGSTIALIPILALYTVAQKYFVRGIALTGLGGR